MKLEVYRALSRRCRELVHRQEALRLSHYHTWLSELKTEEKGGDSTGVGNTLCPTSRVAPWDAFVDISDVDFDALLSIYLQCYKHHIRKNAHIHKTSEAINAYVKRLRGGESILDLARSVQFPPYMLMRYIIKHGNIQPTADEGISDGVNDYGRSKNSKGKKRVKVRGPGAHSIDDKFIRAAVQLSAKSDPYFSPSSDIVRMNVGVEFEFVLQHRLKALGVPFQSEDEMRHEGRSKTPDIRLIVPIAITSLQSRNNSRVEDGSSLTQQPLRRQHIINWIDSKAMFGDPHTHVKENMAQLQGYVHRYGPGMVIYWFDFVDYLNNDPDILLCRDFPPEFVTAASGESTSATQKAFSAAE